MTERNWVGIQALLCLALVAPTGRAANRPVPSGELIFDHPGGYCQTAFTLTLGASAEASTIYYTTNGDDPRPSDARRYVLPIEITTSVIVRAAAYQSGTNLAGAGTRTFLFAPDVLKQTGAGLPKTWGAFHGKPVPAYYGMTTPGEEIAPTAPTVAAGLRSIATLSIVARPADIFSDATGIYSHPLERGGAWERRASLEMFEADGRLAFQCDAGLRIHGGTSREPTESPKHSFRLIFKKRYGTDRLRCPLFGPDGAQDFDALVLRAGNNDSWLSSQGEGRARANYLRDEWMRQSMSAMGHPSARGRFVHLYLNGLYWGVYNLCEQPGPNLLATVPSDRANGFDVRKGAKTEAGDDDAWNTLMSLANAGVAEDRSYEAASRYLDLPELADYLILNFYAGNRDWDRSANWYAIRPRAPSGRFQFLVWDGESALENRDANTLDFDDDACPPRLFQKLSDNATFRKMFATRAQRLLSRDGPLAPAPSAARFQILADQVGAALAAEAARWGAYRRDAQPYKTGPFERYSVENNWLPEINRLLTEFFPHRSAVLARQFRARGLLGDQLAEP